ncbi:acetate--CoA ligase [Campylobacter vulpis]|nr:acetate--CoA ligase [Campylobacter vulpis]MBS4251743.1 acetate--CoA ligase [Campylobacter vulpis]MBS4281480.1 acetate--CoA ligase [Campylobacter vulpis]MBS4330863.1 acetate--CoA ligase [Campylobacter vulpis]MBS4438735.1 acetate--CoA ligase [Campylobacter vulpis]
MMYQNDTQLIKPNKEFAKKARIKNICEYYDLYEEASENFENFWSKMALEKIDWFSPFSRVLNGDNPPFYKWFEGGTLNVSYQCLDRHMKTRRNKAAIVFEGEMGDYDVYTYRRLFHEVCKAANLLKRFDVKKGDRVVLYMPMIPESAILMLACARIGAIHSVVFGGFSPEALRDRIIDAGAKLVITADGAFRRGKPYMLKPAVDKALSEGCECVEKVLVVIRNNEPIEYVKGRDYVYNELVKNESYKCEPEIMDSEDLLFLLYTSGSTGKPKGVMHASAGYILWAQMTMEWVFDIKDYDNYWCSADIGWITGHTYVVYGPLACGATTIMYEGTPTYPNSGRWWRMIEEYQVSKFYTSPTAIRMLYADAPNEPKNYDLNTLEVLGTVGEPINPSAWEWFYKEIGNSKSAIVDTWWQTETGGHMITPLPGATPLKPSCATLPLPGIFAEIIDEDGNKKGVGEDGLLCITKPWPSMIRGIWKDEERYKESYFSQAKKDGKPVYFSGDGAFYDEKGYITITGRTDDVVNVAGHRIGTAEVESALAKHKDVAESAVVSVLDSIKGESLFAFVVLNPNASCDLGSELETLKELNDILRVEIGPIAKIEQILYTPGLPKTRSGKIMRRILRTIARKEELKQDISTLEDSAIVASIIKLANEQ